MGSEEEFFVGIWPKDDIWVFHMEGNGTSFTIKTKTEFQALNIWRTFIQLFDLPFDVPPGAYDDPSLIRMVDEAIGGCEL